MKHAKLFLALGLFAIIIIATWLRKVFSGELILQQTFHFGVEVYYYGLILAAAILCAYWLVGRQAPRHSVGKQLYENICLVILIGGFLGARAYHVFSSWDYYTQHWSEIVQVWNGGLSIFGAIFGGWFALWLYQGYFRKTKTLSLLDWLAPGVALGQAIGRFGNLFNYEAYGNPTSLPWKMFVPERFRLEPFTAAEFFHPLFLYESIACLLIAVILVKWTDIANRLGIKVKTGQVFWLWLGLYSAVRIYTEWLRVDSPYIFNFKQNLLVCVILLAVSIYFFARTIISKNESKTA